LGGLGNLRNSNGKLPNPNQGFPGNNPAGSYSVTRMAICFESKVVISFIQFTNRMTVRELQSQRILQRCKQGALWNDAGSSQALAYTGKVIIAPSNRHIPSYIVIFPKGKSCPDFK
jgi:hypothetical protein